MKQKNGTELSCRLRRLFGALYSALSKNDSEGYEVSCSLTLVRGEIFELRKRNIQMRVVTGIGWIVINGKDFVLGPGEEVLFVDPCSDFPRVSALGDQTLRLEWTRAANGHPEKS